MNVREELRAVVSDEEIIMAFKSYSVTPVEGQVYRYTDKSGTSHVVKVLATAEQGNIIEVEDVSLGKGMRRHLDNIRGGEPGYLEHMPSVEFDVEVYRSVLNHDLRRVERGASVSRAFLFCVKRIGLLEFSSGKFVLTDRGRKYVNILQNDVEARESDHMKQLVETVLKQQTEAGVFASQGMTLNQQTLRFFQEYGEFCKNKLAGEETRNSIGRMMIACIALIVLKYKWLSWEYVRDRPVEDNLFRPSLFFYSDIACNYYFGFVSLMELSRIEGYTPELCLESVLSL